MAGCTSLQPVSFEPEVLRREIAAGNIVRRGDRVRVTTTAGETREFKVDLVTGDALVGKDIQVPISDIASIETREYSPGRTGAFVGGATVAYAVLVTVALSSIAFLP
jgi:hypothetical protein